MDEAFATSPGNLLKCFTTLLIIKNSFNRNQPSSSLKPLPLPLLQQALQKLCSPKKFVPIYIHCIDMRVCVYISSG